MSGGRLYLLPDTNIFLEFSFFDEIDWHAVAGRDAAFVVVTRPVITELDRHTSEHRSPKKRERARVTRRKFEEHQRSGAMLRGGTPFELWAKNPTIVDGIDASYPDDLLIASALQFAQERGVEVAIVTGDLGVRLRVEAFGLKALALDETLRRPHEQDDLTVRIGKLEAQLAAKPTAKLVLTYGDGSIELSKRFFRYSTESDNEIEARVRSDFAKKRGPELALPWDTGERAAIAHGRALRDYHDRQHITFAVELLLSNEGTAPADDIHVAVEIPSRFTIETEQEEPPEKPDPTRSLLASIAPLEINLPGDWSKDSDTSIICRLDRLKQSMVEKLPPFFLTLRNPEDREPAELTIRVNAGTPPIDDRLTLAMRLTGH
jgi:hypothetical protein